MPTTSLADCRAFAKQIAACAGTVPDALERLLTGYEILSAPRPAVGALASIPGGLSVRFSRKAFESLAVQLRW